MAVIALTDAYISVNSVVLDDLSNNVVLNFEVDALEVTAFGDLGHKFSGGLQNISAEVTFYQDFSAAKVEATIYPLVGTTTTVKIRPTSSAIGATNPEYTLTGTYVASHTPVAGAVGELAMTTVSFQGGVLTKAVA